MSHYIYFIFLNLSFGAGAHSIQHLWFCGAFFPVRMGRYLGKLFQAHSPFPMTAVNIRITPQNLKDPTSSIRAKHIGLPNLKVQSPSHWKPGGSHTHLLLHFQASIEQAKDQVFLPLPAPSALLGRLASYSLLLQHLSTYYSYSCWAAAFYSSCFLIGTFSQMGEANRSFINPFQVAAKCVGGLYVIFVNEVPSGIEP